MQKHAFDFYTFAKDDVQCQYSPKEPSTCIFFLSVITPHIKYILSGITVYKSQHIAANKAQYMVEKLLPYFVIELINMAQQLFLLYWFFNLQFM